MISNSSRFQESSDRARVLKLETVIKSLAGDERHRAASPGQIAQRRNSLYRHIADPLAARTRLERILQGDDLTDISYLAQGLQSARSVCRVVIRRNGNLLGYGTGFLVAPGVLLTNHHVLPTPDLVPESIAQFSYERDVFGRETPPVEFALRIAPEPILFRDLDIAIVAVEPRSTTGQPLQNFSWLKLNPQPGKAFIGEYLTIIQHPKGERKQICVRENKLLSYSENGPFIWYQTDTVSGSSGSPVFNNSWDVVALHHSSVPRTKRVDGRDVWLAKDGQPWKAEMGDDQIDWIANEGVRVSRILQYLAAMHSGHALAAAILTAKAAQPTENLSESGGTSALSVHTDGSGKTRILIPIEIGVNVGWPAAPSSEPKTDLNVPVRPAPRVVESVIVDQKSYPQRNGYDPLFLSGQHRVPLPQISSTKFGRPLLIGDHPEIKYWNYSVAVNRSRGLAFYSAANIAAGKFRGSRDADGDTWYRDTRVDELDQAAQLGREFYKKQREFEADRTMNPFDQGHLTRRRDLQWGDDDDEAKRNGDDSYHYTNCSPQHWQFNQDSKVNGLWFRLEESALKTLSNGSSRLCVINGPIFDAPLCIPDAEGRLHLNLNGKRVKDGTFGGVKIPKMFFKVIAYVKDQQLAARAFIVTQENLLTTIDRYYPAEAMSVLSDLEVRLFQVKLSELEAVTGLDFGLPATSEMAAQESMNGRTSALIEDESALIF